MNTNEVGHGSSQETSVDSRLLDELIFRQDLNEVHLLIDFISGRADRSLSTLSMPHPTTPDKTMTSGEIAEAISKMRYPPPEGTPVINAKSRPFYYRQKTSLALSRHLRRELQSLTRQCSSMQKPAARSYPARLGDFFPLRPGSDRPNEITLSAAAHGSIRRTNHGVDHDTRIDLAQRTFPGLRDHARKFRLWRDALAFLSIISAFFDRPCLLGCRSRAILSRAPRSGLQQLNN